MCDLNTTKRKLCHSTMTLLNEHTWQEQRSSCEQLLALQNIHQLAHRGVGGPPVSQDIDRGALPLLCKGRKPPATRENLRGKTMDIGRRDCEHINPPPPPPPTHTHTLT